MRACPSCALWFVICDLPTPEGTPGCMSCHYPFVVPLWQVAAGGVRARGVLIRDVSVYLGTCILVLAIFSSGEVTTAPLSLRVETVLLYYILYCGSGVYFSEKDVRRDLDRHHRQQPGEETTGRAQRGWDTAARNSDAGLLLIRRS